MKKIIILTLLFAAGVIITGCKNNHNTIQKSLLEKSWTQSSEESMPGEFEVYRPSDYKELPPSRYRQIFNFRDNDLCEYLVLEANDRHTLKNGSWEFDEKTNILKISNENFEVLYEFEVIELGDDMLKLKTNSH